MIPKKKQYKGWTLPSKYTFWGAIIGLICLIIAIGQIKSCALQNKEDKKKDREEARSGLLENKNDSNYNEFEITVGGFTSIYEKQQFLDGLEISKLFVCNDVEPITIKLLKGNITLNSKFYNLDNEIVGEIENNEWQLNNNYYKRNYDDKAIEVIDNYDVVVMQIRMENNKIIVNGIIHCSSMLFICNEGSSFQLDTRPFVEEIMKRQTGKSLKDVYIEQGRKINRIFEYTGENWLGKRRI